MAESEVVQGGSNLRGRKLRLQIGGGGFRGKPRGEQERVDAGRGRRERWGGNRESEKT